MTKEELDRAIRTLHAIMQTTASKGELFDTLAKHLILLLEEQSLHLSLPAKP